MFVSVIMPVYNSEKFLAESIESILNQTYSNFEFLIFNDGSTDNSLKIIESYAQKDQRIILINSEKNTGYVDHLNNGILLSKGDLIARMDSDDISLPKRLELQVKEFEKDFNLAICGTFIEKFGALTHTITYPLSKESIALKLIYSNPFCHPSIMIRKSILISNNLSYDKNFMPAEDSHLWSKIILKNINVINIDKILLKYRIHHHQISIKQNENQRKISTNIYFAHFCNYFLNMKNITGLEYDIKSKIFLLNQSFENNSSQEIKKNILLLLRKILNSKESINYQILIKIYKLKIFTNLKLISKLKYFINCIFTRKLI